MCVTCSHFVFQTYQRNIQNIIQGPAHVYDIYVSPPTSWFPLREIERMSLSMRRKSQLRGHCHSAQA